MTHQQTGKNKMQKLECKFLMSLVIYSTETIVVGVMAVSKKLVKKSWKKEADY